MIDLNFTKNILFRVSTPYSLGIGFKVEGYDWIITNENLVRGNHSVVVENLSDAISYAKIIYIDPLLIYTDRKQIQVFYINLRFS